VAEKAFPLPLDSVGLGQAETGETILQLGIGQTTLAFLMPMNATVREIITRHVLKAIAVLGRGAFLCSVR
jgi:hypothetical protein